MGVAVAEHESVKVPKTLEEAVQPAWLERALAPVANGAAVESVEVVDVFTTMASKVRVAVRFAGSDEVHRVCLKAFLGWDEDKTTIREAKFYTEIAPHLTMRVPHVINTMVDEPASRGMLIMEDMIAAGVRFCSALEPFTVDQAAASLDQIARLHAASHLLPNLPWVPSRICELAAAGHHLPVELVQGLLDDPRGEPLQPRTRDAARLYGAMDVLAARTDPGPQTLLHGDCHAGNLYMTADGPGFTDWQLIQHGLWAFDVAYHINAILPVDVAEREERRLLDHYVDAVRGHGGAELDREAAWADYRMAQPYGFYHWAITRRVDPAITKVFTERLGKGVERHDSYRLLGL